MSWVFQEELTSSSVPGTDERSALRDWNEEFQCYHELPASSLHERINRAKMIYKALEPFIAPNQLWLSLLTIEIGRSYFYVS